jgi:FkbM family methyltransferase
MSDFNLKWVSDNFKNYSAPVFFEIGGADISGDHLLFKKALPHGKFYVFECAEHWKDRNLLSAQKYNLNYFHMAVSDIDGNRNFSPAYNLTSNKRENFSGRLIPEENLLFSFNESYSVKTIKLSTFCQEQKIYPDILHIDAEKSEHLIFQGLDDIVRPKCIWFESDCYSNEFRNTIHLQLEKLGYHLEFTSQFDSLYLLDTEDFTDYVDQHYDLEFYETVKLQVWIDEYNIIKGAEWPRIQSINDFDNLSPSIKDECKTVFNFSPDLLTINLDPTNQI